MGLDVGDSKIGVAITDKHNRVAYPVQVFENSPGIRDRIKNIITDKNIEKIVVGMPLNLKGEAGYQAKKVMEFIQQKLEGLGPEIVQYDERFTSKIPKSQVKGRNREAVDKYSACIILNDYLTNYGK
ncbi:MAG: Holliday junction resolvase RuvX [Actinomycetota bacterium]